MKAASRPLLDRLAVGKPIAETTVVVAAHPDDETIGLGGRLQRFADLRLIHVTDGAPMDLKDASRAGFETRDAYAAAREAELEAALARLGATPQRFGYGLADQAVIEELGGLTNRLLDDLRGTDVVITHAYEGGHPDHDACALAVQAACDRLGASAPLRLEFAGYHAEQGAMTVQRFWPDGACVEVQAHLTPGDRARKASAFAAYRSQAEVIAWFNPGREAYRLAPAYDFMRPPPPGGYLYDGFGFGLTGEAWSRAARCALAQGLAA